jgi:hypothetical protein
MELIKSNKNNNLSYYANLSNCRTKDYRCYSIVSHTVV